MDTSRYQNGSIYKLCCKDITITDIYVGSTCNFTKRKWSHKNSCKNENSKSYSFYVYQFIRDHGDWDNWEMIELIKYPCDTKRELALKEREYLELLGGTLNKQIPSRSKEESTKAHYQKNKKEINEKRKEKFNCNCGGHYTKSSKAHHLKSLKHQKYLNKIKA